MRDCAVIYRRLHAVTRREGLSQRHVDDSRQRHSSTKDGVVFVTPDAYQPTGVALGHPLPDVRVTRRLWRLTRLIDRYLSSFGDAHPFAFVPSSSYHVTIYSRSHFDRGAVFDMERTEHEVVERLLSDAQIGSTAIDFHGMLLSKEGRVLVCGYPVDDGLWRIRDSFTGKVAMAGGNPPTTAHIKLGHVLIAPTLERVRKLSEFLDRCSQHVSERIVFADVFTPAGRISLTPCCKVPSRLQGERAP
ncbi:MAG TPA: hypothetical protein VIV60_20765 [Polyangiaceae bacterium]